MKRKVSSKLLLIRKFKKFLYDNDALNEYYINHKQHYLSSMPKMSDVYSQNIKYWITAAFWYSDVSEGIVFWFDINDKWQLECMR
jgi:hypothetical protein